MSQHKSNNMQIDKEEALEAQKKVFDTLKCPCCWKFVGVHFEQCLNSHIVCSQCRDRVPNCPVCREKLVGKPVLLAQIIEELITIFEGLSSGNKAVDVYLRQNLTPEGIGKDQNQPSTPNKKKDLIDFSEESPVYNAERAKKSVKTFLQQQNLMFYPRWKKYCSSKKMDSSND